MYEIKQIWDEYFFSIMICSVAAMIVAGVLFVIYVVPHTGYVTPHDRHKADLMEACMKVENNTDICNYEYLKTLKY